MCKNVFPHRGVPESSMTGNMTQCTIVHVVYKTNNNNVAENHRVHGRLSIELK